MIPICYPDWLALIATHLIADLTAEHRALREGRLDDAADHAQDADRLIRLAWHVIDHQRPGRRVAT